MYILCLLGRDIIGLAETGSGKTGAFALPILNALLETPQRLFALVLTPTRELAFQISEQFEALGSSIGVQCGKCWEERNLHRLQMNVTKWKEVLLIEVHRPKELIGCFSFRESCHCKGREMKVEIWH